MEYIVINKCYTDHSVMFREEAIWFNSEHKGELKNPKNYLDILELENYQPENSEVAVILRKQMNKDHKEEIQEIINEYLPQSSQQSEEVEHDSESNTETNTEKSEGTNDADLDVGEDKTEVSKLELMTIKQLQKYAAELNVDLEGITKKHDIIEAIVNN